MWQERGQYLGVTGRRATYHDQGWRSRYYSLHHIHVCVFFINTHIQDLCWSAALFQKTLNYNFEGKRACALRPSINFPGRSARGHGLTHI